MAMIYKLVSFTPEQLKALKREAKSQKIPVTELIRNQIFNCTKAKEALLK